MKHKPSFLESIAMIAVIVAIVGTSVQMGIGMQIPLFICWFLILSYAQIRFDAFELAEKAAYRMIREGFGALMIVLSTGALIATWISGGMVPALIYYGLELINPKIFLLTTLLFCSIVSIATGTSYGTAGTAGLAMVAVGTAMGIPPGVVGGAVICGSLFGDKLSAFSDTTNMAAGITGTRLYDHIKHMLYTTVPAYLISAAVFTVVGFYYSGNLSETHIIADIMADLTVHFKINWLSILPLFVVILLLVKRVPALLAIMIGIALGFVCSILVQGNALRDTLIWMWSGYVYEDGSPFLIRILNNGGIQRMGGIFIIGILGMGMGGMLRQLGVLDTIMEALVARVKTSGGLILCTLAVSYFITMVSGTVNFSIVLAGTIFRPIYREEKLASRNLSRTLEDACTMGAVFFPWNANSVFFAAALGISWSTYLPWCMLSYLTPLFALIYGYTGKFIMTLDEEEKIEHPHAKPHIGELAEKVNDSL